MKRLISILILLALAISLCVPLTACTPEQPDDDTNDPIDPADEIVYEKIDLNDAYLETRTFVSLYELIGDKVNITMVDKDSDTGISYATVDGVKYELGLDFLSKAMIYNISPIYNTPYYTKDLIKVEWWKLYCARYNYLCPDITFFVDADADIHRTGLTNYAPTPYRTSAQALVPASYPEEQYGKYKYSWYKVGTNKDMQLHFRYPTDTDAATSADKDIFDLTNGYSIVTYTDDGRYQLDTKNVLRSCVTSMPNEDGIVTYQLFFKENMTFSDGSPITAKNYLYQLLAFASPVGQAALERGAPIEARAFVGFSEFAAATESTPFIGIRLVDDYTIYLAVGSTDLSYLEIYPTHKDLWMPGDADIMDDGDGCYLTEEFYKTENIGNKEQYVYTNIIKDNYDNFTLPFSGAYEINGYTIGATNKIELQKNYKFAGDYYGNTASIERISYISSSSSSKLFSLLNDRSIDGIIGINSDFLSIAQRYVDTSSGEYAITSYNRLSYAKIHMRCDFGPMQFLEVRRALAYSINKDEIADALTKEVGDRIYGPYSIYSWLYILAGEDLVYNKYDEDLAFAEQLLIDGGWIYNSKGKPYTAADRVRYKKLEGEYLTKENMQYSSVNGTYKTIKIDGEYYMPLVVNTYGIEENDFSTALRSLFISRKGPTTIGMAFLNTIGTSINMQGELFQNSLYGYNGTPRYSLFTFALKLTKTDYSKMWEIDVAEGEYDSRQNFLIDYADRIEVS